MAGQGRGELLYECDQLTFERKGLAASQPGTECRKAGGKLANHGQALAPWCSCEIAWRAMHDPAAAVSHLLGVAKHRICAQQQRSTGAARGLRVPGMQGTAKKQCRDGNRTRETQLQWTAQQVPQHACILPLQHQRSISHLHICTYLTAAILSSRRANASSPTPCRGGGVSRPRTYPCPPPTADKQ